MQALAQSQFQTAFNHGAVQSVEIEPRLFGTVDSAMKLLHKLGVRRIVLERLEQWHPKQSDVLRRSRPDRAEALTRAAEYGHWVRAKVESSRADPRPAIADDE